MKKRILLLNPPYPEPIIRDNYCCFTSKSGYQWAPVDLLYVSGMLHGDKHFLVSVIDAPGENISREATMARIKQINPDSICCLTGTVSFKKDMEFVEEYKKIAKKKIKLFVLGNTPCFAPSRFLVQFPFVDGIFHNFMDVSLLQALLGKLNLCGTCSYRVKNKIKIGVVNFGQKKGEIKGIHPPLYHLFPLNRYSSPLIKKKPFITMMTAFGCPFACSFCIASRLNHHTRNLEELKKELLAIKKAGIWEIFFEDSTFNANSPFMISFLKMLTPFKFSWSANIHSFNVTPGLIDRMKQAGCHTVQIGVESGSSVILKKYAPSKVKEKITSAIEVCKKENMRVLGYFIIGFPDETKQQVLETISYAKELDPEFASFSTLTPDYGTKIYNEMYKKDKSLTTFDSSGTAVLNNRYISPKDQDALIQKAYREFYLQPKKLISFLVDFPRLGLYLKNGLFLISKKMLNK